MSTLLFIFRGPWIRQRFFIHFSIQRQRNLCDAHKPARDRLLHHSLSQPLAQLFFTYFAPRPVVTHQLRHFRADHLTPSPHHHTVSHFRMRIHRHPQLAQLYPVPAYLHLPVATPKVFHYAAAQSPREVSRAIAQPARPVAVLHKPRRRQLSLVVVTSRHTRARDHQLAPDPLADFAPAFVHHVDLRVRCRPPDRHLHSLVLLGVIAMDHATHCRFRRPILVDDLYAPAKALPHTSRQARLQRFAAHYQPPNA